MSKQTHHKGVENEMLSVKHTDSGEVKFVIDDEFGESAGMKMSFATAMLVARDILRAFPSSEIKTWTNDRAKFVDELRGQVESGNVSLGAEDLRLILKMMGEW